MKRFLSALAAAALGLTLLTACGADNGDGGSAGGGGNYCDDLKSAKKKVDSLENGDFGDFDEAVDTMHELADEAPDEVADDWKVFTAALDKIVQALEDAGISGEDLAGLQNGEMPEGVDMAKLQQLAEEMQSMDTAEFEKAGENIKKHAKDECGVDLDE